MLFGTRINNVVPMPKTSQKIDIQKLVPSKCLLVRTHPQRNDWLLRRLFSGQANTDSRVWSGHRLNNIFCESNAARRRLSNTLIESLVESNEHLWGRTNVSLLQRCRSQWKSSIETLKSVYLRMKSFLTLFWGVFYARWPGVVVVKIYPKS